MKLYLITGFLGAGKTTALKSLIGLMAGQKLHVIVNEFGGPGADAGLLRPLRVAVDEIAGGSAFCTCRLEQFEAALETAAAAAPDVILVEASGLANPGSVEKLLARPRFDAIDYQGSLCLVDAAAFEKVLATVPVCKKQLAISQTVVVNKTDLVDETTLRRVLDKLRETAPEAAVYTTAWGRIEAGWLPQPGGAPLGGSAPYAQTRDLGLARRTVHFGTVSRYQLEKFVSMLAPDTHRIKGYVRCTDGLFYADCVGERVSIAPAPPGAEPAALGLAVLAGPGLPMEKGLAAAAKWYAGQIERIA